jgi:hypothetical protein
MANERILPEVDLSLDRSFRHYFIMQATSLLGCAPLCGRSRVEPAAARKRRPAARDEMSAPALQWRVPEAPEEANEEPSTAARAPALAPAPAHSPRRAPARVVVKPSPPLPHRHRNGGEYDDIDALIPGVPSALFRKGGSWKRPPPPVRPVKASAIFGDSVLDGGPVDGCGL